MIAENHHSFDLAVLGSSFLSDLAESSVMIEPCQASDIFFFDFIGEMSQNVSIGIGRIGDDNTLDIRFCGMQGL